MALEKIVDYDHLLYFKQLCDGEYQAKVEDKGLSENDFTDADKTKLDGIAEGATKVEIARNLTSGTKVGTITINGTATDLYCQTNTDTKAASSNKASTKLYLIGATTQSTSGQTGYSNANCYVGSDNKLYSNGAVVLTEHQDISGKQDNLSADQLNAVNSGITSTKVSTYDGYATTIAGKQATISDLATIRSNASTGAGLKTKVDGIAAGAQVNVIESIKVNGTALTVTSKGVNIDLSGYATKSDIADGVRYKGSVDTYSALPTSPAKGDLYNVKAADTTHGVRAGENVVWTGSAWDTYGGVIDLSDYIKTADITLVTNSDIDAMFSS